MVILIIYSVLLKKYVWYNTKLSEGLKWMHLYNKMLLIYFVFNFKQFMLSIVLYSSRTPLLFDH